MKECFKCHETLPLSEFYRHPQMADGHLGKCKRCTRHDMHEHHRAAAEKKKAYYAARHVKRIEEGYYNRYRRAPEKLAAQRAVSTARANGTLIPQPCRVCGAEKVDAHHEDYSKPLEVMWLCRTHHMALHRMDPDRRPVVG